MRKLTHKRKFKAITVEKKFFISWRFTLICTLIVSSFSTLLWQVMQLQIFDADRLRHEADLRSLRIKKIVPERGMILDRNGRTLAVSVPVYAVGADPYQIMKTGGINDDSRWATFATLLKKPLIEIISIIVSYPQSRFIYFARQLDQRIAEKISQLQLPGIRLISESRRYYPSAEISAHLIGLTNIDGDGIEGIEKSFNHVLIGNPGRHTTRRDRQGRSIESLMYIEKQAGQNLQLTIDEKLQTLTYNKLHEAVKMHQAKSGSAILLDIQSGEILAMVNSPAYNPNHFSKKSRDSIRNSVITDIFEPASTIKPIVILAALAQKIVNENSIIDTRPFFIGKKKIQDVGYYEQLSITEILQKSSNVGVARLALQLPKDSLLETYRLFGIGELTNIGLIGESSGLLPKNNLSALSQATLSYGYGLMMTPLQLAHLYATLGRGGVDLPPSIIKPVQQPVGNRVFKEKTVRTLLQMLEKVTEVGGIGIKAAVPGYRVAVKTGTSKKTEKGEYVNKYISYAAGIAPVSNPRFSLVILINEPSAGAFYGGTVAAPIFSNIMSGVLRIMNIAPDAIATLKQT